MLHLLIAQFLLYALAWSVAGMLLREARRPVAWWSLYCLLQAVGLALQARQPPELTFAATTAVLSLLASTCADVGIDLFVQGPDARRPGHARLWLVLGGGAIAAQLLLTDGALYLRGALYNLGLAGLLIGPLVVLQARIRQEFGWLGLLPFVPGMAVCGVAVVRAVMLLADPALAHARTPQAPMDNPVLVLTALVAAGLFNISFTGLVIGRLVRRLARRADADALTELDNRASLERQIAAAWAASSRSGAPLSLAFIDIDHFKPINDLGGHEAGDQVMRAVARVLQRHARQSDVVGRWGGDEFLVLMPACSLADARLAARRLREQVQLAGIAVPAGCDALSLSIGVAAREAGDGHAHALIQRADSAMYEAKRERARTRQAQVTGQPAWS